MSYLIKLITPEGGVVLDPFMGSGSCGIAAALGDFNYIGMELDEDYFKIAEQRIKEYEQYRKLLKK
jgi:DNA modification methylase